MQSRGLIHAPLTKMNDSSLSEAPPDHHQSSTKFHSGCETLWLAVQVLGKADNWTHKMNLLQSSTVQSLWSFANLSLTLLCFSLMKGFCLALHNSSPASMSLSRTILSVHFTPAVCHYFCLLMSWLLSDIQMSWRSSQSVESHYCPLLVALLSPMSAAWPHFDELLSFKI